MTDPETEDPLRGEAEAQDEATVMPWIWGGLGVLVVVAFVAWLIFSGGHRVREPPGAAPATRPISHTY
jgi:hypothetical protein